MRKETELSEIQQQLRQKVNNVIYVAVYAVQWLQEEQLQTSEAPVADFQKAIQKNNSDSQRTKVSWYISTAPSILKWGRGGGGGGGGACLLQIGSWYCYFIL